MVSEATGSTQEPQKKRGRPKGSKNKDRASESLTELTGYVAEGVMNTEDPTAPSSIWGSEHWEDPVVAVRLASEHAQDGLESTIKAHVIVGVSALPNGNASIITNIGVQQPFILVTAEPYESVKSKVFPNATKSGV